MIYNHAFVIGESSKCQPVHQPVAQRVQRRGRSRLWSGWSFTETCNADRVLSQRGSGGSEIWRHFEEGKAAIRIKVQEVARRPIQRRSRAVRIGGQ